MHWFLTTLNGDNSENVRAGAKGFFLSHKKEGVKMDKKAVVLELKKKWLELDDLFQRMEWGNDAVGIFGKMEGIDLAIALIEQMEEEPITHKALLAIGFEQDDAFGGEERGIYFLEKERKQIKVVIFPDFTTAVFCGEHMKNATTMQHLRALEEMFLS